MTTEERITTLESELALLKQRDEHRQSEHVSLLHALASQRRETDETLALTSKFFDERIAGLAARVRTGTGGEADLVEIFELFTRDVTTFVVGMRDKSNEAWAKVFTENMGQAFKAIASLQKTTAWLMDAVSEVRR